MSDETLEPTASEEEQPVAEAVSEETPAADLSAAEPTPDASTEQPSAGRTWAGKYQSPEEMERAYLDSQREASRMAGELAALKRQPERTTSTTGEPQWKQLEGERNKWAQHLRNPNLSESERYQADEQVRLYDREIGKLQALSEFESRSRRDSATGRLEREAQQVMSQYASHLADMQSPLYQAAAQRLQDMLDMGAPDNQATRAMAVTYAAAVTGATKTSVVSQDRKALLTTLNKQAKQAVVAGAGAPAPIKSGGVTAQDLATMSDADFRKYERDHVLGR